MSEGPILLPMASAGAGARLHVTRWPVAMPRAIVLIAHGLFEHAGRYAHVAARLNGAGYGVVAIDHLGHGRSDGTRGFVPAFSVYRDGMDALLAEVQAEWPRVPLLLLGHSMGGLIAVHHLLERQAAYAAAAVSGPAILPAAPPSALTIWISRLLARVAPRLGVVALDGDGVSRDPAVVAAYKSDPMAAAREGAAQLALPLLVQHGDADRMAAPAGGQYLFDHAGSADKRLLRYPGLFHEIYNEPEQAQVLSDLVAWFDAHVPQKA